MAAQAVVTNDSFHDDTSISTVGADFTFDTEGNESNRTYDNNLATNPKAFDVIKDLMERSVPLLVLCNGLGNASKMVIETRDDIRANAKFSLKASLQIYEEGYEITGDILDRDLYGCEIVVCMMHMYLDHPLNFSTIEGKYDVLTKYLLPFPTFESTEAKYSVLRTL